MRVPATLLAVLLLLLPAAAVAQVPQVPLPTAASVAIKAPTDPLVVSLDKANSLQVIVTNTQTVSPAAQLNRPRFVAVTVQGATDGWNPRLDPSSFMMNPGETRQVTLTVSVSAAAPDKSVKLTLTAKMYSLGVNSVPLAGPNVDPEAIANADVTALRTDSPQRALLETVGPYVWILLLAIVAALVIILSLVAANRRVAVRLSANEPQHTVTPGQRTVFPVLVHNITRRDDTVVLRVPNVPEGWATFLPTPQLDLEAGQQEEVPVVIIAPKDAAEGTKQPFTVTAISAQAPRRPATVVLEAEVVAARGKRAKESPAPEA